MTVDQIIDAVNANEITLLSSAYKLVLSLILGSVIGYERKRKGQIAGVRTFSLICMGATLAMILSIYVPQVYLGLKNGDPSRIAAQVVSGIGFLGAGAIIQMKGSVRGLTTAAGIWMVAALGMAVGVGLYWVAVIATVLVMFILTSLERIEHRIGLGNDSRTITITVDTIIKDVKPYRETLKANHVHLVKYYVACDYDSSTTKLSLMVVARETVDFMDLFDRLRQLNPTKAISLANQVSI